MSLEASRLADGAVLLGMTSGDACIHVKAAPEAAREYAHMILRACGDPAFRDHQHVAREALKAGKPAGSKEAL